MRIKAGIGKVLLGVSVGLVLMGVGRVPVQAQTQTLSTNSSTIDPYSGLDLTTLMAKVQQGVTGINTYRAKVGLQALTLNTQLDDAAQGHANYMTSTNLFSHEELLSSNPLYIGLNPWDRGKYFGYSYMEYAEDMAMNTPSITDSVSLLVDAPYHRVPIFMSTLKDIGIGIATSQSNDRYDVIDFGSQSYTVGADQTIKYPYDGQTGVSPSWVDTESPDPLSAFLGNGYGTKVGYPITLFTFGRDTLTDTQLKAVRLTDPDGNSVPIYPVDLSNGNYAFIPKNPLFQGTVYQIAIQANNQSTSTPDSFNWQFKTTGTTQPIQYSAFTKKGALIQTWNTVSGLKSVLSDQPGGYISDPYGQKVYVEPDYKAYTQSGTFLAEWTSVSGLMGQLTNYPGGTIVDAKGNVVYTQPNPYNYTAYDASGNKLIAWSSVSGLLPELKGYPGGYILDATGNKVYTQPLPYLYTAYDASGNKIGAWSSVSGLLPELKNDPGGYILDANGNRVYTQPTIQPQYTAYDANGRKLGSWTSVSGLVPVLKDQPGGYILDSNGTRQYTQPSAANLYTAYDASGHALYQWTSVSGLLTLLIGHPGGYILDASGNRMYTQP